MKRIKFLMMAFAAILCVSSFVACGDDDNNSGDSSAKNSGTPDVTYEFKMSKDVAKFIDVTITYYDASGTQQTKTMTEADSTFTLEFTPTKNQKAGMTSTYKVKSNINELIAKEVEAYQTALVADPNTTEPRYNLHRPVVNARLGVYNEEEKSWSQLYSNLGTSLGNTPITVAKLETFFAKFSWSDGSTYSGTYDAATNRFTLDE